MKHLSVVLVAFAVIGLLPSQEAKAQGGAITIVDFKKTCVIDWQDPEVSRVSMLAEKTISQLYRMSFISEQLCYRMNDLRALKPNLSPALLAAYSMEYEAHKHIINARSATSYVNYVEDPDYPQYAWSLSETNQKFVANALNTASLRVNFTTVAGNSLSHIQLNACRAAPHIRYAINFVVQCR